MEMLTGEVRDATRKRLDSGIISPVSLLFFTQEATRLVLPDHLRGQECLYCRETRQLLEEVSSLSGKIKLEIYDFVADKEKAAEYLVTKIPAVVIQGAQDYGIRFFGIPSGYEYMSLLEAVIDVSRGATDLSQKTKEALKGLDKSVHIQVFVTPTCPYCTTAVRLAHQFALETARVRGDMIEATEFPHLAQKYGVLGVPKTVFNESLSLEGAVPEDVFLDHVLRAAEQGQK
jgi:glutaredoxin-like protein